MTTEQRLVYEDGRQCGLDGLIPVPSKRYRGRLAHLAPWWCVGHTHGLTAMMGKCCGCYSAANPDAYWTSMCHPAPQSGAT